jgi:hypothetical protein
VKTWKINHWKLPGTLARPLSPAWDSSILSAQTAPRFQKIARSPEIERQENSS